MSAFARSCDKDEGYESGNNCQFGRRGGLALLSDLRLIATGEVLK